MGKPKTKKAAKKARPAAKPRRTMTAPTIDESKAKALVAAAQKAAFADTDPAKALAHFAPLAAGVSTDGLAPFNGSPLVMLGNVNQALKVLGPHLPSAVVRLGADGLSDVFELPSLVLALDLAANRVPVTKLSSGEIAAMLTEGGPWRLLALTYLDVVSSPLLGLVPQERVKKIREGTGPVDKAQDFVALANVFGEFAGALEAKHPFPTAVIDRLASLGAALLQSLKPGGAIVAAPARAAEALLRDRLAALVEERFDALMVFATVALGKRAADDLLPALRSAMRTPPSPATPPAPPAPPTPAPSPPTPTPMQSPTEPTS